MTKAELKLILENHKKWLETSHIVEEYHMAVLEEKENKNGKLG